MQQVRRWDTGTVGKVQRTDQGYLRCDATITRTGVFSYVQPGGKVRRELRLPSEVFDEDALRSFGLSPLTNGHPPVMLDARNTARYQVGSVVEPRRDGDHVAASVQITDSDAIADAESGRRQLSCGYTCDLDMQPGVTAGIEGVADGQHYDAVQRRIRGNHVAMVDQARAGATVQLRLDGADAFQVVDPDADPGDFGRDLDRQSEINQDTSAVVGRRPKTDGQNNGPGAQGVNPMESKVTVDGVDYECTPQVEQAVAKLQSRIDELETAAAEQAKAVEAQTARADAAEENLAAEKQAHADAADPAKLRAAVDARLSLERAAAPVLGDEVKLDEMADAEIRRAVVVAAASDKEVAEKRLDGCSDDYLQARFDAAIETWQQSQAPNAGLAATRTAAQSRADSVEDARARMIARNIEAGRKAVN